MATGFAVTARIVRATTATTATATSDAIDVVTTTGIRLAIAVGGADIGVPVSTDDAAVGAAGVVPRDRAAKGREAVAAERSARASVPAPIYTASGFDRTGWSNQKTQRRYRHCRANGDDAHQEVSAARASLERMRHDIRDPIWNVRK
jgi:hypothetical protein